MLDAVAKLHIPILMHPPEVGASLEVVRTHPQIDFVLAHLGSFAFRDWQEHVRAIEAAKHLPNLYRHAAPTAEAHPLAVVRDEVDSEALVLPRRRATRKT
jgi:predicted TIM-barrel fold metal-dependent hydrolase